MELCHATARRYGVRFGVAPVGTPNYALQYSDAARWLRQGTVDYLMPQLYWGQEYVKDGDIAQPGRRRRAILPRAAGVRLYAGWGLPHRRRGWIRRGFRGHPAAPWPIS